MSKHMYYDGFFYQYNLTLFAYYVAVMIINCRRKLLTFIKIY